MASRRKSSVPCMIRQDDATEQDDLEEMEVCSDNGMEGDPLQVPLGKDSVQSPDSSSIDQGETAEKQNSEVPRMLRKQGGYECKYCPFFTQNLNDFKEHVDSSHPNVILNPLYLCAVCNFNTKKFDTLTEHNERCHPGETNFKFKRIKVDNQTILEQTIEGGADAVINGAAATRDGEDFGAFTQSKPSTMKTVQSKLEKSSLFNLKDQITAINVNGTVIIPEATIQEGLSHITPLLQRPPNFNCIPKVAVPLNTTKYNPLLDSNMTLITSFNKFPYPTHAELSWLTAASKHPEEQIKVWFTTQRLKQGITWSPEEVEEARKKMFNGSIPPVHQTFTVLPTPVTESVKPAQSLIQTLPCHLLTQSTIVLTTVDSGSTVTGSPIAHTMASQTQTLKRPLTAPAESHEVKRSITTPLISPEVKHAITPVIGPDTKLPVAVPALANEAKRPTVAPVLGPEAKRPIVTPVPASDVTWPIVTPVPATDATWPIVTPVPTSKVVRPVIAPVLFSEAKRPIVAPVPGSESKRPIVAPVPGSEAKRPIVAPVPGSESKRPIVAPVPGSEAKRPIVAPLFAAEAKRPIIAPLPGSEAKRPIIAPVPGSDAKRPIIAPVPGSEAKRPIIAPVPGSEAKRPIIAPVPGSEAKRPIIAPVSGSEAKRPIIAPMPGSEAKRPIIAPVLASDTKPISAPVLTPETKWPVAALTVPVDEKSVVGSPAVATESRQNIATLAVPPELKRPTIIQSTQSPCKVPSPVSHFPMDCKKVGDHATEWRATYEKSQVEEVNSSHEATVLSEDDIEKVFSSPHCCNNASSEPLLKDVPQKSVPSCFPLLDRVKGKTAEQLKILEESFQRSSLPAHGDVENLVSETGLSKMEIDCWFSERRALRDNLEQAVLNAMALKKSGTGEGYQKHNELNGSQERDGRSWASPAPSSSPSLYSGPIDTRSLAVLKEVFTQTRWPTPEHYSHLEQQTGLARMQIVRWFKENRALLKSGALEWMEAFQQVSAREKSTERAQSTLLQRYHDDRLARTDDSDRLLEYTKRRGQDVGERFSSKLGQGTSDASKKSPNGLNRKGPGTWAGMSMGVKSGLKEHETVKTPLEG